VYGTNNVDTPRPSTFQRVCSKNKPGTLGLVQIYGPHLKHPLRKSPQRSWQNVQQSKVPREANRSAKPCRPIIVWFTKFFMPFNPLINDARERNLNFTIAQHLLSSFMQLADALQTFHEVWSWSVPLNATRFKCRRWEADFLSISIALAVALTQRTCYDN